MDSKTFSEMLGEELREVVFALRERAWRKAMRDSDSAGRIIAA
jgi:hypothetical protein